MAKKTRSKARKKPAESGVRRKLIAFDAETWDGLDQMRREGMRTWQELADEAFRDLLRKHGRPIDLKDALRKSARAARRR